jgi:hypothetical protein
VQQYPLVSTSAVKHLPSWKFYDYYTIRIAVFRRGRWPADGAADDNGDLPEARLTQKL